jgi:hypothetical protein
MHVSYYAPADEDIFDRGLAYRQSAAAKNHFFPLLCKSFPPTNSLLLIKCLILPISFPSPNSKLRSNITHQMRILYLLNDTNIIQLDIQVLIHTLQRPPDLDVVLQLDRNFVVHEGFEETISAVSKFACEDWQRIFDLRARYK